MRGKVKIRFGWQLPERLVLSLLHFLFFLTAYYEFSILSIAANVLFLPFMGGILVTSLAGIGLGGVSPFLQENSALICTFLFYVI